MLHVPESICTSLKYMYQYLKSFVFIYFTDRHEKLKDLTHDLDIWHKSAKLVKALTDVIVLGF